jgi:uncharacterized protein YqeY
MTKEQQTVNALRMAKVAIEQALLLHAPKKISKAKENQEAGVLKVMQRMTRNRI